MRLTRLISSILLITLFFALSFSVQAAEPITDNSPMPIGSSYINSYVAYCTDKGDGKLAITFSIDGTGPIMDEIGTVTIDIMEKAPTASKYSVADTYICSAYPEMMGENARTWSGEVEYDGTVGYTYKAIVTFWVEKDNAGDSSIYTTEPVTLE